MFLTLKIEKKTFLRFVLFSGLKNVKQIGDMKHNVVKQWALGSY